MSDFSINPLVVIGVGCGAFAGVFYHLYQEKRLELQKLQEIPVFKPDRHLLQVLRSTPFKRLQYVVVEGMVQPDADPLPSKFVPRHVGVIQKIVEKENWKYWNNTSQSWNSRTVNKKETNNSVPFSLISPGAYICEISVKVKEPLEASGLDLESVYSKVRRAQEGFLDGMANDLSGEKPVSKEESEEMLHIGTTLTGFGEVVLEGDNVIKLQAPLDNRKYILMPTDYRSFMGRHEASANMFKTLSAVTGITGVSILAAVLYNLFGNENDKSTKARG